MTVYKGKIGFTGASRAKAKKIMETGHIPVKKDKPEDLKEETNPPHTRWN